MSPKSKYLAERSFLNLDKGWFRAWHCQSVDLFLLHLKSWTNVTLHLSPGSPLRIPTTSNQDPACPDICQANLSPTFIVEVSLEFYFMNIFLKVYFIF